MFCKPGAFVFALAVLASFGLTGCATDDPEYNAFYHNGWLWPRSMDNDHGQIKGNGIRDSVKDPTSF
jgi:hypothetical protein